MEKEISCHLCGGKAELMFEELLLDNGRIILRDSPYYRCKKCKEEFSTSEQMQLLSNKINSNFVFQRPIINAGRSLAITIPSDITQFYKLKKGMRIKIMPENRHTLKLEL